MNKKELFNMFMSYCSRRGFHTKDEETKYVMHNTTNASNIRFIYPTCDRRGVICHMATPIDEAGKTNPEEIASNFFTIHYHENQYELKFLRKDRAIQAVEESFKATPLYGVTA